MSGFRPVSVKGFELPKVEMPEVKLFDYSSDLQKANEGNLFNIFSNETDVVSSIPIDFSDRYVKEIGEVVNITFDEYRKTHVIQRHTEQLKWIMENQDKIVVDWSASLPNGGSAITKSMSDQVAKISSLYFYAEKLNYIQKNMNTLILEAYEQT